MAALNALPKLPELTVSQAEHWIAAALAEARALRQYDDKLFPPSADPAVFEPAKELHAAWSRWVDDSEALYERVRPLLRARQYVNGATDLDHAIGRTRAMLQITPESWLEGLEEGRRGDVVPHEEIRRELRDRLAQRRAASLRQAGS
jgi:hypothetical protein